MKMTRAFLICALLLSFGCQCKKEGGKPRKKRTQAISINITNEPHSLDPRKARALGDQNTARTFMEGLMRINKHGITSPAIADKYNVSSDMKTYTFKLKETNWSNNTPLTAHDFVYSWKKTLSPEFLSDYAFLMYVIKNGKGVKEGKLPSSMLGIHAEDDYTLVVELENQTPYFLELLSFPTFFPVCASVDEETPDWHRNPKEFVCNGPFTLTEWRHNDHITAEKNSKYWDQKEVSLAKIQMVMVDPETGLKMFQNKELDWEGSPHSVIPVDAITSLKDENLLETHPFLGTYWIRTNTDIYPFHSEKLRKSLAMAINRKEIVEHVMKGGQIPATGIVPISLGLQDTPYFSDGATEEALSLFNEALQEEEISPKNIPKITLSYVADNRNHRIAQTIQDQWKKALQINVTLEPLESKVYFDRISKKDYQLACGSWIADFRDPINFLEVFKAKNIGTNNTGWESLDYQKALETSYLATTKEERALSLKQSEQIIMDEMPVIPVYHYTMLHVKNEHLKDVLLTDLGGLDFKYAYVTE